MTELNDPSYYTARAAKARESAASAIDPEVAVIHTSMAERYAALAELPTDEQTRLRMVRDPVFELGL